MSLFEKDRAEEKSALTDPQHKFLYNGFRIPLETWKDINSKKTIEITHLSKNIGWANLQEGQLIGLTKVIPATEEEDIDIIDREYELLTDSMYRVEGFKFDLNDADFQFTAVISETGSNDILFVQFDSEETNENTGVWNRRKEEYILDGLPSASLVADKVIAKKLGIEEELVKEYI